MQGVLGISSEVYTLDSEVISTPAEKYLQKPSIEIMEKEGLILRKETDSVLVDTGIVIFSGCAFDVSKISVNFFLLLQF